MSQADSFTTTSPSRRTVLAGISVAVAPAVAAVDKSIGAVMPSVDPIYSAMERHKAAVRAFSDSLTEQSKLEKVLPRHLRQSRVDVSGERIVETDDPRWIANQRAVDEVGDKVFECALALLDVRPTTTAGMVNLFRHVVRGDEADFPSGVLFDDQDDSDGGVDFSSALLLVAVEWLENGDLRHEG
jgi:hypothetical protein